MMMTKVCNRLATVLITLILAGCGTYDTADPEDKTADAPPQADSTEGVVQVDNRRIAAELTATPAEIAPDGRVQLRVANRGEQALHFGRPFTVERWDGESWVETEESRNSMWTMDLLYAKPGTTGEEQAWPFIPGHRPEPGWYRMTKQVSTEPPSPDQAPISLTIRTRVQVRE